MNEKEVEEGAVAVMPIQDLVGLSENCLPHLFLQPRHFLALMLFCYKRAPAV